MTDPTPPEGSGDPVQLLRALGLVRMAESIRVVTQGADAAAAVVTSSREADRQEWLAQTMAERREGLDEESLHEVLPLLLEAQKAQPPAKWLERWGALRERLDPQPLRAALVRLAEDGNARMYGWGPRAGDPALIAARGALWALGDFIDAATRDFLVETVTGWASSGTGSPALGYAAIWALARPGDEEAARRLLTLNSTIAHKNLRARLDEAIASLAGASHLSVDELADRQVPDHGLNERGELVWELQGYRVRLRLGSNGSVAREVIAPDGRAVRALPPAVRQANPEVWPAITRTTKDLKATVGVQRARLEDAMVQGRTWTAEAWRTGIGGHPVLGSLARRLVWQIDLPGSGGTRYGMPRGGGWLDESGGQIEVPEPASLSIVHPVSMPDERLEAWQRFVVRERVVQPFKQVFRETYVVTPVEAEAPYASARFSGFPVSLRQIYALARTCGWGGPLGQTFFDGAGRGEREFPSYNVRAVLEHSVEPGRMTVVERVSFERNVDPAGSRRKRWQPMRLTDVPLIPFSEAMRDVDLIVSVSAVGTDAQWREWEAAQAAGRPHWLDRWTGDDTSLAEVCRARAAVVQALLGDLGLVGKLEIRGRFAVVRGQRAHYRVHLATGSVHLEPGGRYLCIVPAAERDRVYLPFEDDDEKTSEIISKIVLLAHDSAIQDRRILGQLPS